MTTNIIESNGTENDAVTSSDFFLLWAQYNQAGAGSVQYELDAVVRGI